MKYREFREGDIVLVTMPQGSGFEHPQEARVIEKGDDGVVLFERQNGRRWWANSRRIKVATGGARWKEKAQRRLKSGSNLLMTR